QPVQPFLAARGEHQSVPTLRQLPRELDPQARRSAGDQRDFLHSPALWTLALMIFPGSRGGSPTGSASTYSMPLSTSPQTVYCRSRNGESSVTMKNWLLALSGFCERGSDPTPRLCDAFENSAFRFGLSEPCIPVPVGSPPCAMKPGITR